MLKLVGCVPAEAPVYLRKELVYVSLDFMGIDANMYRLSIYFFKAPGRREEGPSVIAEHLKDEQMNE